MNKAVSNTMLHLSMTKELITFFARQGHWALIPGLLVWAFLPVFILLTILGLFVVLYKGATTKKCCS